MGVPAGFRADLPRWRQLVSAHWLADLVAHRRVAAAPPGRWMLLEVACDGLQAFQASHLPGARYLDTRLFEQLPYWNCVPRAQLLHTLQLLGLDGQVTAILYGRNMLAAARVAQLLLVAGLQDVRLLDGGLGAWCTAGLPLAHGQDAGPATPSVAMALDAGVPEARVPVATAPAATAPEPPAGPGHTAGADAVPGLLPRPDYLLGTAQARALLGQPDSALVSIRTRAEYWGETSGYSYIAQRGEIAGALWGHAGLDGDVNSMRNFQDAQGRMKPAAEIAAIWAEAGIHPSMQIAFYCGTGWRASLAFFYAWLMGWPRISVYDGGWYAWSADPANPVICRSEPAQKPALPQSDPVLQSLPT